MYLQKVISKKTYPDPYQNVTDPQHCWFWYVYKSRYSICIRMPIKACHPHTSKLKFRHLGAVLWKRIRKMKIVTVLWRFRFGTLSVLTGLPKSLLRIRINKFMPIYLSYIYLGSSVCHPVCHPVILSSCHPVCRCCGTLGKSLCFSNQTDEGDKTEGLEMEGLEI